MRRALLLIALIGAATPPALRAGDVVINEFMAANATVLADEDGDHSDWIELYNRGAAAVDLEGWCLTDDASAPAKWRFPSVAIEPGAHLLVFASGKDRRDPAAPLHTSFRLSADGEYLALVMPDGRTVAHEFAPSFPPQRTDISYGFVRAVSRLVSAAAEARVLVPADGAAGLDWIRLDFDDAAWTPGPTGLGYDTEQGADPSPDELRNLAPEGVATQSSTGFGYGPELAINSRYDDFTHTAAGVNLPATWELDLGGTFFLYRITLYNRTSCCGSRLRDITVSILDEDGASAVFTSEILNPENVLGGGTLDGPATLALDLVAITGTAVEGGIIRVVRTPDPDLSGTGNQGNTDEADVLSLGEVEVLGAEQPPGYRALIGTDLEAAMYGRNASAYARIRFDAEDPSVFESLALRMKYDDGFIAYLNGREAARRNAPLLPSWDAAAPEERRDADAFAFEDIPVAGGPGALAPGPNILAIHGLNHAADDPDFLILPELVAVRASDAFPAYCRTPTPGTVNDSTGIVDFVADTRFSRDRGFYDAPFLLEITTATPGAEIRYTLDGTPPTETSGVPYTGPIPIATTTTVRAAAFKEGLEPTNVDTHTYIFTAGIARQDYRATLDAGFPSTWGDTTPDYGMDPDVIGQGGADLYGGKYTATVEDDLRAVPTMSIVLPIDAMFGPTGIYTYPTYRGVAWERPCSVEVIYPHGGAGFQTDAGIRIQGGAFRSHSLTKKHSLRLLFKRIYGSSKLAYALFGPGAPDRFDTITLRANSNDGWQWDAAGAKPVYVRDSFGRETVLAMGGAASHEIFVHLYINGVYWGLYNPVERPDASFCATYFGGDKDTWDSLSNNEVSQGSYAAWDALVAAARQVGTTGPSAVAAFYRLLGRNPDGTENPDYECLLDAENYADYMIANLYVGNTDWPTKNWWMGRNRADSTGFKFFMWDSEWSMGIQSDLYTNRIGVSDSIAAPWSGLRANAEFQLLFADRVHRCFFNGGPLYVDPNAPQWDPAHPERNLPAARFAVLAGGIDRAIVPESARWGDQHVLRPYTRDEHWAVERDNLLKNYLPQRSRVVLDQFRAAGLYPAVAAPVFNRHGGAVAAGFIATLSAPQGAVYYTLDGADPRLPGGALSPAARAIEPVTGVVLLDAGAEARILVPRDDTLGLEWIAPGFDDSSWRAGPTGVGFDRAADYLPLIATNLESEMYTLRSSAYVRLRFSGPDPSAFAELALLMKYDDGFAAYLNGTFVAARNAPEAPVWNSGATASRDEALAVVYERIELPGAAALLAAGENVLAIHGLNSSAASVDFLIVPAVEAVTSEEIRGIVIEQTTAVRARAWTGSTWSALAEAVFRVLRPIDALRITEIMYNPRDEGAIDGDRYEFIELRNTGAAALDLSGVAFTDGIDYIFPEGFVIEPGRFAVLAADAAAFTDRYPAADPPAGVYAGNLSNSGEVVTLAAADGTAIVSVPYDDVPPWPVDADGFGPSLVPVDPAGSADPALPSAWRASLRTDGSPGEDDVEFPPGGLQLPGDLNQDGRLDIADAIAVLQYLFGGRPVALPCSGAATAEGGDLLLIDINGDARVDVADAIALLGYLFGGARPPALGTECLPIPGCPTACGR